MDDRLTDLERAFWGLLLVVELIAWVAVVRSPDARSLDIAMVTMIVLIVLGYVVYALRLDRRSRKREEAQEYLLESTQNIYFYGYSLAECLEVGLAWDLYWYEIGDFARQIGLLVLQALRDRRDGDLAAMQYRANDRYVVWVVFAYDGGLYQLDLSSKLGENNPARIRWKSIKRGTSSYQLVTLGDLTPNERVRLRKCRHPERSVLSPDRRYVEPADGESYTELVDREVDRIISWRHYCEESTYPDHAPEPLE